MDFIDTPYINYFSHPGFSGLNIVPEREIDIVSMQISNAVQNELELLNVKIESLANSEITKIFEERITPLLRSLEKKITDSSEVSEKNKDYCNKILNYSEKYILEDILINAQKRKQSRKDSSDLQMSGIQKYKFKETDFSDFNLKKLHNESQQLIDKSKSSPSLTTSVIGYYTPYFSYIEKFLKRNGIVKVVSQYLNCRCRVDYVALVYNTENELWWKDSYKDVNLKDSPMTYYHYDFSPTNIKCIIYLSEVTHENGPFKYIQNSYSQNLKSVQHYLFKCVDRIIDDEVNADNSIQSPYYRRKFLPQFREQFLNLPSALRGSSHFGDDIIESTELATLFSKNEKIVLSSEANLFLFDGSQLMHRGGLVNKGGRWALQVGISPRKYTFIETARDFKKIMKSIFRT